MRRKLVDVVGVLELLFFEGFIVFYFFVVGSDVREGLG